MSRLSIILIIIFSVGEIIGQTDLSIFSFQAGIVRNFQDDWSNTDNDLTALYFNAGIGGKLITDNLNWQISIGYLDESINTPLPVADYETINHTYYDVNFKILYDVLPLFTATQKFQLLTIAGINYSFIEEENISFPANDNSSDNLLQPYIGIQTNIELITNLKLLVEVGSLVGVSDKYLGRYVLLSGLKYIF